MSAESIDLTGVWHGLYAYPRFASPVYFVATLIGGGSFVSGTTHEAVTGSMGAPLTLFATLDGGRSGSAVDFTKLYDGTGGWSHSVAYEGLLNDAGDEIDGTWRLRADWSGRFLMIRSPGATESVARQVFAKAG
jgi:hypothetical protein